MWFLSPGAPMYVLVCGLTIEQVRAPGLIWCSASVAPPLCSWGLSLASARMQKKDFISLPVALPFIPLLTKRCQRGDHIMLMEISLNTWLLLLTPNAHISSIPNSHPVNAKVCSTLVNTIISHLRTASCALSLGWQLVNA